MSRPLKVTLQLLVSGAVFAILLWRIDLGKTIDVLSESDWGYVLASLAIFVATTWLMTWRWWVLLAARGVHESYGWLLRLYFVSNAAGQVLPTAVGGDAVRIIEHARRRPDARATAAGAVVMERILGAVITVAMVAVALAVAGRYEDVRFLVLLEVVCVGVLVIFGVLLFSRRLGRHLEERLFPLGRHVKLEDPLRSLYRTMHEYRNEPGVLLAVLGVTVVAQSARVVAIWLCGEAVGIDVSPGVYVILGPLLFFVQMVPFTLNGLGVREAFFVAFLGRFDVEPEAAFAVGFLYFAVSIVSALPGAAILVWRSIRPFSARPQT